MAVFDNAGVSWLHSVTTLLIMKAINEWAYDDSEKVNVVMFLDLKKVFDTVDHETLLSKLEAYRTCFNHT